MTEFNKKDRDDSLTPSASRLLCPAQLKKNSFWGMARSITSTLLFAISYPLYLRYLGLEVFGIWVMLMAVVSYLQLGSLNLPQTASKFISESLVNKDMVAFRQYSTSLMGAILGAGLVIILLTYFGRQGVAHLLNAPETLRPQIPYLLMLTALLTFQALLTETFGGIVSGIGRMDQVFQADILCRGVSFLLSLGLLHEHYGLLALFYGNIAGYLIYGALVMVFIKRNLGFIPLRWRDLSWPRLRQMVRFTGPLFGGSIFSCLLQPFNRLLLGSMISPAAASIYDIADKGAQVIRSHAEAGLRPLMPQISALNAVAVEEGVLLLILKSVKTIILWASPLFILFFVTIDYVTPFWLKIDQAKIVSHNFYIILWGYYANLLSVPFYYAFMGRGQVRYCFYAHAVQSLINMAMAFLGLLTIRQIWVVSLASAIGMMVSSIVQMLLFFQSRDAVLLMARKGLKTFAIPLIVFAPLFLFINHLIYLIIFSCIACCSYIFFIYRWQKAS